MYSCYLQLERNESSELKTIQENWRKETSHEFSILLNINNNHYYSSHNTNTSDSCN
jgi:lysylphosphatidylglycerol synthetase-like protein (DUF2156 family)